ncbi:MAG: amidohydrolase family protein, partial [Methylococcaceae bacterium]|nr:amidohydrolase family protein [Methylococcaceae bacterium]
MNARIHIRGGRVIDPTQDIDAPLDLYIAEGRILALGTRPEGFAADLDIDAGGQIVCPGFIDLSARLGEPGFEHKATIASESLAAVAGGITTVCQPPDTSPVIDTPAVVQLIQDKAKAAGSLRVLPVGALTRGLKGLDLSEMSALGLAGCRAVSNAYAPVANPLVLRRALEYAASHDLLVIVRPEDEYLADEGCVHEGPVATRLGLRGIPYAAETVAVAQVLALIEHTGVHVHFAQLSSARAMRSLARAQEKGFPVTADVAAHQLHLTEEAIEGFDAHYHLRPPLRSPDDREALRDAVQGGIIAAICSDHQPHEPDAKLDAFPATEPGMAALQTLLPLVLKLVEEGALTLPRAIASLTAE